MVVGLYLIAWVIHIALIHLTHRSGLVAMTVSKKENFAPFSIKSISDGKVAFKLVLIFSITGLSFA